MMTSLSFGCVCEFNIKQAFMEVETEIIDSNLNPLNDNLESYAKKIKKNTDALKEQTPKYQKLVDHEAALALKLDETLFELRNINSAQSIRNQIIAEEVEAILKQNVGIVIREKKILEKERY